LRASHIKPWRDCSSAEERLSASNGLLLTPTIDHLFDRGFISFEDDGTVLRSPVANEDALQRMGVQTTGRLKVGSFTDEQKFFLNYHREEIFLQARLKGV
jgi:putative restriction endonuclease